MAETHEQRAREIEAQMRGGVYPVQILAAALAEVERETARKCAEMVDCESTRNGIRRAFGLEEGAK